MGNYGDISGAGSANISEFRGVTMADPKVLKNMAGWGQAEMVPGLRVLGDIIMCLQM